MTDRFSNMKKVPNEPARRLLAAKSAKLGVTIDAPASASVEVLAAKLAEKEAWVDVLRLLSVALPEREAVWWACLAARDTLEDGKDTPCLKAAETWVFEPTDENRAKVEMALETVDTDDDTALVASAALYAPGTLGTGEMAKIAAPPAAVSSCVFGMNMTTLDASSDPLARMGFLIDRGVDIGRGGNGKIKPPEAAAEEGGV